MRTSDRDKFVPPVHDRKSSTLVDSPFKTLVDNSLRLLNVYFHVYFRKSSICLLLVYLIKAKNAETSDR